MLCEDIVADVCISRDGEVRANEDLIDTILSWDNGSVG